MTSWWYRSHCLRGPDSDISKSARDLVDLSFIAEPVVIEGVLLQGRPHGCTMRTAFPVEDALTTSEVMRGAPPSLLVVKTLFLHFCSGSVCLDQFLDVLTLVVRCFAVEPCGRAADENRSTKWARQVLPFEHASTMTF